MDQSKRTDGVFSRNDFSYDLEADVYTCPAGNQLLRARRNFHAMRDEPKDIEFIRYRASKLDCDQCKLKSQCCPTQPNRHVMRSAHEGARQMARDIAQTEEYALSCKLRKKVEMLFAHLKRIPGLRRLRLRGPSRDHGQAMTLPGSACGANDEFLLAATAQNLRKLAKLFPIQQPPKPA